MLSPGETAFAAAAASGVPAATTVDPLPGPAAPGPGPSGKPQVSAGQQVISGPPPVPEVDPLLGSTIGSFKLTRRLGVGGMGTVYLGEQAAIGSKVAIKVLHEHLCSNPSLVQRFYAEARAANVIGHEHIVSIIDLNVIPPSRYYFVMEYLEGKALNELPRPMAHPLMVHILEQCCDALQAAHTNGVVHRDLKPENIILTRRGRNDQFVKLLDFGIAKLFATELAGQQTVAGMIMGTPEFMAPEQTSGEQVDGRTDLYALGVIAYELATGRLPFTSANLADLFIAHRMKEAKPPHVVNPSVPVALSQVIMKSLAKAPSARFQTADEFREALVASLEGTAPYRPGGAAPAPAARPPAAAPPPAPGVPWEAPAGGGAPASQGSAAGAVEALLGLTDSPPPAPAPAPVAAAAPAARPAPAAPAGPAVPVPPGAPGWKPPAARPGSGVGPRPPSSSGLQATSTPASPGSEAHPAFVPGSGLQATSTPASPGSGAHAAFVPGAGLQATSAPGSGASQGFGPGLQATSAPGSGSGTHQAFAPGPGLQATSASGDGVVRTVSSPSGTLRGPSGSGLHATSTPAGPYRTSGSGLQGGVRPGTGATPAPLQPGRSSGPPAPLGSSPSRSTPSQQSSPSGALGREVRLYEAGRGGFRVLRCTDLSRSGMFIHAEAGLPAVFSQVKLGLLNQGRELQLTGEVVRHVTPEQSRAWGMPVGFAIQLGQLSSAQKDGLAALLKGAAPGTAGGPDLPADPQAEAALARFRKYANGTFYDLLDVFEDADFPEVRQRIRDQKKQLEELRTRPLSGRQRDDVEAYDRRLDEAFATIGNARNRLDYDGGRGNWKGAARCIAGGVSVTELDNARRRFLATRDKVEGTAHLHFTTGSAWENQKEFLRAQQEFERALGLDPLNLTFHQRYQALRRFMTQEPRKR